MAPPPYVRHRRRDRRLSSLGSPGPAPASHPVVDESLGGSVLVSRVERDARLGYHIADSLCLVRRGGLCVEQRKQSWFVEGHCTYAARVRQRRDQRDRRAIRMPNQRQWRASSGEHWLDEPDFVPELNDPVRWPVWAVAGVVGIESEDAEPWRKEIHQPAPLPGGARVRM